MDFSAKFKKTVDRTCVTKILQKIDQLLAYSKADPEIEERKLPEKPQIQSCITKFFKNNKK